MRLRAVSAVASIAKARVREEGSGRGWEEREREMRASTQTSHTGKEEDRFFLG